MVTADFADTNIVIFDMASSLFSEKFVSEKCSDFDEMYMYVTNRVSEAHGFLKAAHGKIERMYYMDEETIIDQRNRLPEEKKNKIKLPHDFEELKTMSEKRSYRRFNEDTILTLAYDTSTVEKGTYPYEAVIVGDAEL